MDDAEGGGFFLFDRRFLDPIVFKLSGELHVQSDVGLGVGGLPGSGGLARRWVTAIDPHN